MLRMAWRMSGMAHSIKLCVTILETSLIINLLVKAEISALDELSRSELQIPDTTKSHYPPLHCESDCAFYVPQNGEIPIFHILE